MRVRFRVSGRVQGVGYRWFVRERASDLGLVGWVANREDGIVEVEAQGGAERLETLEKFLAAGTAPSHVTKVEKEEISEEVDFLSGFRIVY